MHLTRSRIVTTARMILESEGATAVTMRRLGRELESAPMSLYHHVGSRAALLAAVLEQVASETPRPELPADPRDRLVVLAGHMLAILESLPWVVDAILRRDGIGADSLWFNDRFIAAGQEAGLTERQAVHLFRTVWLLIIGSLFDSRTPRVDVQPGSPRRPDPEEFPALTAMLPHLVDHAAAYDLRRELEVIVDGHLALAAVTR